MVISSPTATLPVSSAAFQTKPKSLRLILVLAVVPLVVARSDRKGTNMSDTTIQDRAAGAIMGAFIGDAMGLGPHWYYELAELHRDYGDWISNYTDPQPGRYHSGLKAGQLSQAGFILKLTLRSLVERGGYDEADFCSRMDEELLPLLEAATPTRRRPSNAPWPWRCAMRSTPPSWPAPSPVIPS